MRGKSHLLEEGRALCSPKITTNSTKAMEACQRCVECKAKSDSRKARDAAREQRRIERIEQLASGMLVNRSSGNLAIRYSLNDEIIEESIGTANPKKAAILLPLCMKQIRRTGRPLREAPTCKADLL